uniref:Armadillo repeat-containing protein 7 n=1 Tax=Bombyx mori TaxID=7091 RepID=A0A8R1WJC5_BOMMO|nr:armadillo repeat-containing protein 7 isoform X2 [Bombyx mori]
MFSSRAHLQKRTPKDGTDREAYLSLLVDEYLHSSSYEAKLQVLANLANFAYDPVNYSYIRDVGVLDIFLYVLKNETIGRLIRSTECRLYFNSLGIKTFVSIIEVK